MPPSNTNGTPSFLPLWHRSQQLWQLGDLGRDPARGRLIIICLISLLCEAKPRSGHVEQQRLSGFIVRLLGPLQAFSRASPVFVRCGFRQVRLPNEKSREAL